MLVHVVEDQQRGARLMLRFSILHSAALMGGIIRKILILKDFINFKRLKLIGVWAVIS
jgi:hypothetical protein